MATVFKPTGLDDGDSRNSLVALKIEVCPELMRDIGSGCCAKIFTLIPQHVRTVRAFKNHLATKVLKTHTPFYFYNGDYRISDEDDVQIFSLLTEPCRIEPVPKGRSALSTTTTPGITTSTPLPLGIVYDSTSSINGTSPGPPVKRVKFSDESLMESDIGRDSDQVDNIDLNGLATGTPLTSRTNGSVSLGDLMCKKKRKRTRRRKGKKGDRENKEENSNDSQSDQETGVTTKTEDKSGHLGTPRPKSAKNKILQDYDADESEIDHSQTRLQSGANENVNGSAGDPDTHTLLVPPQIRRKFQIKIPLLKPQPEVGNSEKGLNGSEFLSPNTVFSEIGYKRLRNSNSSSGSSKSSLAKYVNRTPDIDSSGYGPSPLIQTGEKTEKRRQDTPMLPRILKNPCATYELVKNSLNFNARLNQAEGDGDNDNEDGDDDVDVTPDAHQNGRSDSPGAENGLSANKVGTGRRVDTVDEINVGDTISFKVLELDEKYTPTISLRKEAVVMNIKDFVLTLKYTGAGKCVKQRSGAYEIEDEEMATEALDDPPDRNFSELIEPRVVSD